MKKLLYVIAISVISAMLAICAFAGVTATYNIEEATTDTGESCYKIVMTQTDTEGDWKALETLMKFNVNKIVPIDWYDGTVPSYTGEASQYPFVFGSFKNGRSSTAPLTLAENPAWTIDGANSQVLLTLYWGYTDTYPITASDTMIFEMYFKYADGVTKDDLTSDDFVIASMAYGNGANWGYNNDDPNKMEVVNNVVPAAPVVNPAKLTVAAGDKIYLEDGTVVEITESNAGEYELPAGYEGYVAVNSGVAALTYTVDGYDNSTEKSPLQKTYYVSGEDATLVHTNGIVSSETNELRFEKTIKDKPEADGKGLRFLMVHDSDGRAVEGHEITEVGVLMTVESEKVYEQITQETIDNLQVSDAERAVVKKGYALGDGRDMKFNQINGDATQYVISAVMYNIKLSEKNVKTNVVCRPFYKVGDTYIYGETVKATLFEIANEIKNDTDTYNSLNEEQKEYVDSILFYGGDTEVIEGEVIIDISGLYN